MKRRGLLNLMPARKSAEKMGIEVVTDLDALVSRPIAFRFKEETYVIQPMTTGETLEAYASFAAIDELAKRSKIAGNEMIDAYADIFGRACPEFTREHVEKLTPPQLTALFHLIIETVTGKVHSKPDLSLTDPEKKTDVSLNAAQPS